MPRHRRWRRDAVEHRRREHRRGQHGGRGGLNGPAAVGVLPAGHRCARGGADLHVRGAAGGAAGQGTGAARRGPGGVPGALARRRPAHSCSYAARGIGGIAGVGGLLRRRSRRTGRAHELGRAVGVSRTAARTPRLPVPPRRVTGVAYGYAAPRRHHGRPSPVAALGLLSLACSAPADDRGSHTGKIAPRCRCDRIERGAGALEGNARLRLLAAATGSERQLAPSSHSAKSTMSGAGQRRVQIDALALRFVLHALHQDWHLESWGDAGCGDAAVGGGVASRQG